MRAHKNPLISVAAILTSAALLALLPLATVGAQEAPNIPQWALAVHREAMSVTNRGPATHKAGVFPRTIPRLTHTPDSSGTLETLNQAAPTDTRSNPFFQVLGTNGRACVTCHEPRSGWTVNTDSIKQRFNASGGRDPIFRPVDGATCSSDDVSTLAARRIAYSLLLNQGLIRISLPLPTSPDFQVSVVSDPYGCTDLTANPPMVSVYRRPLPASNLQFLTKCPQGQTSCTPLSIMWDGREPSLASQATDATLGHAQAANPPSNEQVTQMVDFESNLFDAQLHDRKAGALDAENGEGGAIALSQQDFYIGINDSLGGGFNPDVFGIYSSWEELQHLAGKKAARAAIARGETIFNSKQFTIDNVNGLNRFSFDPLGANPMANGTCSVCHNAPNVGNHSVRLALNIGVSDANATPLDVSLLPVFKVSCTDTSGPLQNQVFTVTDLGRAMITGKCADVGKVKGPILRGLAARAPYFHNGSAATLEDVVNFYDQRFNIGLTDGEKSDLVAFLKSL